MVAVSLKKKKPDPQTPATQQTSDTKTKLYKINEVASLFYHKNLFALPQAKIARSYLSNRAISEDIARQARLGFATDLWDGLLEHLKSEGVNPTFTARVGLIIAKDRGGFYDRFRNRIIFPIFDIKSKVIGFGGRGLDDTTMPKYVTSPETPLYIKGKHLYGLNFSKDKIREKDSCLIVEGYLDFLIPYSQGIDNIVASLGTALTKDQIRLIKRYTHNVVMIYDGDISGQLAALRSLDLFTEEGLSVKIVTMEKGFDPDLFVRKFGASSLREKIASAKSLFDFKLDFLKQKHDILDIEQKAKIIEEMLITITKFNNALVKAGYIKLLAEELNVSESAIMQEAKKLNSKQDKEYSREHSRENRIKNTSDG